MTAVVVMTDDGISHGVPEHRGRGSAFRLETTCGLEFQSWLYAGKRYGEGRGPRPKVSTGGIVDCMACLVRGARP